MDECRMNWNYSYTARLTVFLMKMDLEIRIVERDEVVDDLMLNRKVQFALVLDFTFGVLLFCGFLGTKPQNLNKECKECKM